MAIRRFDLHRLVLPCAVGVFTLAAGWSLTCGAWQVSAQQQQPAAPSGAHGGQEPPPFAGRPPDFPTRPTASPAVLASGKATYSVNCGFCHGSDAGGGSVGPNLLRSEVVLQDKRGELIAPIVHGSRVDRGMPRIDLTDEQVGEVADWLHSLRTGGNLASTEKINIVVGNAGAGQQTFDRICASCHSTTGDLKGFAAKYTDPRSMQQAWMLPGGAGGRGPARGAANQPQLVVPAATATVLETNGQKVTGRLDAIDDFYVSVITDDGVTHRFLRMNDLPKVEIHDPLEPHRALLRKYDDKEIHDITAYLETLK
jgi:cytochrome c oxidase cbb3-type subunit 3